MKQRSLSSVFHRLVRRVGNRSLDRCESYSYPYRYKYHGNGPRIRVPFHQYLQQQTFTTTISRPTFLESPSSSSNQPNDWLLQRTKHLLNPTTILDATDPELWSEANHILGSWLKDDFTTDALKRVECCIRLLDRLASIVTSREVWLESLLDTALMNRLVKTWQQGIINEKESRQHRLFTPSFIAGKMDKYRWVALLQPDIKSFNVLLQTTSYFHDKEGIVFADGLLRRLVDVSRVNEVPLMDVVSVATVIHGWVQNGRPDKADEWLQTLYSWKDKERDTYLAELLPNNILYSSVLSGWANVGNVKRAMEILNLQLESFHSGNQEAKVDTITCNCILDALSKSNDRSAIVQAEDLISKMQQKWQCTPDTHSWTSLIACHSNHSVPNAERRLHQLEEEGRPLTVVAYNIMLHAYAKTGQVESAIRLLKKLESSSQISPDETSYNTAISSFANCKDKGMADHADALFRHMTQQKGIKPSIVSYSTLLQCWCKSDDPRAADRVEEILHEMKQNPSTQPNIICYSIVLNALGNKSRVFRDKQALFRALQLFHELAEPNSKSLRPNNSLFRAIIHAIVGSPVANKRSLLESLQPAMIKYQFIPNSQDKKILRRFAPSLIDESNLPV